MERVYYTHLIALCLLLQKEKALLPRQSCDGKLVRACLCLEFMKRLFCPAVKLDTFWCIIELL